MPNLSEFMALRELGLVFRKCLELDGSWCLNRSEHDEANVSGNAFCVFPECMCGACEWAEA